MLEKEFKYFQENLSELLKKYEGKFLVIKETSVEGVFDTYEDAITFGVTKYKLGEFLVQQCVKEEVTTAHFINSFVMVSEKAS